MHMIANLIAVRIDARFDRNLVDLHLGRLHRGWSHILEQELENGLFSRSVCLRLLCFSSLLLHLLFSVSLALYLLHNSGNAVTSLVRKGLALLIERPIRQFAVIEIRRSRHSSVERLSNDGDDLWRIVLLAPALSILKTGLLCPD